jgi:hypothetical protein
MRGVQNDQLTADRANFWKVVDRTKPSKLYLFSEDELRDCQDYFSKTQSDPTVPPNELIMAAERLTLIRSEIDVRHGDANYRRAQRLAWWAIGLAMISLAGGIGFGAVQILTKQPTRENWSVDMQPSTVSTPMAVEVPTSTPQSTQPPDPTPDVSLPPVYAITEPTSTPTPTINGRPRTKHRKQRQTAKKPDSNFRVEDFFRSLFRPRPTQSPPVVRRR